MSKRGLFITLEGPEGAGKSTHAKALARWLRRRGRSVLVTREPGGTAIGQRIRRLLLDPHAGQINPLVELYLYEAARAALVREVIRPALRAGKTCIVDRFFDSTWVYQGWAGGVDLALVERSNAFSTGNLTPNLTILLDVPVKAGLKRVKRPNRMEAKNLSFHRKVREGYLVLARRYPKRIHLIGSNRSLREAQQEIRVLLTHALSSRRR